MSRTFDNETKNDEYMRRLLEHFNITKVEFYVCRNPIKFHNSNFIDFAWYWQVYLHHQSQSSDHRKFARCHGIIQHKIELAAESLRKNGMLAIYISNCRPEEQYEALVDTLKVNFHFSNSSLSGMVRTTFNTWFIFSVHVSMWKLYTTLYLIAFMNSTVTKIRIKKKQVGAR